MAIQTVILAAGKGKRMYSDLPKVLHPLAGKPLLERVIQTAQAVSPNKAPIIVIGHQGEIVSQWLSHYHANWIEQKEQLGTGHAVLQALAQVADEDDVLILYGDVPLISIDTLQKLIDETPSNAIGMLTATLAQPAGYGRIKRNQTKQIIGVVEEKDATEKERAITEINPGIYLVPAKLLKRWLPTLSNKNAQQEYYLTDIISLAGQEDILIHDVQPAQSEEIFGVNDRVQLAHLERFYQRMMAEKLMRQGVTLLDPNRFDIRGDAHVGRDVVIDVNVILEGNVKIGSRSLIGANCILRNVEIGEGVEIKANSVLEGAVVKDGCVIGPFARLRPGAVLKEQVHIGNFVEVKNSHIDVASKVNHLSYIGDSEIGKRVNVGAGTITCNYDGANKHKTIIGDDVHVGSDTQFVAPVTIGEGATIAAGSTITKDVSPHELILTQRIDQRGIKDWKRPSKKSS